MSDVMPEISVVIPVFNEEASLPELYRRLVATMESTGKSFEVIFVNDGSVDGTPGILRKLHDEDGRVRVITLARNFGQSPALYAGFAHVRGQAAVMLDADLQNPPEEIPKLLKRLEEGADLVSGWRYTRTDSFVRRWVSRALNRVIARTTRVPLHDYGCALKAMRRELVDRLLTFSHRSRYLPVDVAWLGVSVAEVKVEHEGRTEGKSKYSLLKLVRTAFDIITSITSAPIQFIGLVGWLVAFIGFFMGTWIGVRRLVEGNYNQFATVVALFFILAGVQMIATGFMCEYISRIYLEVQSKPYYIIKDVQE